LRSIVSAIDSAIAIRLSKRASGLHHQAAPLGALAHTERHRGVWSGNGRALVLVYNVGRGERASVVEVILTGMRRGGKGLRVRSNRRRCHKGESRMEALWKGEGIASPDRLRKRAARDRSRRSRGQTLLLRPRQSNGDKRRTR
jgi:hypothetical protein